MPCNCDGYSEPKQMDPAQAWKSFSRHHQVMELELEAVRERCNFLSAQIAKIRALFPSIDLPEGPPIPTPTPPWRGMTYRDKDGEFPSDIREHLDWLSKEDFQ